MKPFNVTNLIPAGTVMNQNINSSPQQVYSVFSGAIQVVFTGTPTGTFKLQASADSAFSGNATSAGSGLNASPVNWTDVSGSSNAVAAAGSLMYNIIEPGYNWLRLVYTDGSGGASTAVITSCTVNGKGF